MALRKPVISRRASRRKTIFWIIFALLIAGGGAAWYFLSVKSSAQAPLAAQGQVVMGNAHVMRGDIQVAISGSGTLIASQTVDLSFSTGGAVAELNVKVGDAIKTGDVLARLGNVEDLEAALASAKLQLLEAQKDLADLQKNAGLSLAQAYQELLAAQESYDEILSKSQRMVGRRCSQEVTARYAAQVSRLEEKLSGFNPVDAGSDAWISFKNDYDTALANYTYCVSYTEQEKEVAQSKVEIGKLELQQTNERYETLKLSSGIDPDALELAQAKVTEAENRLADAQENLEGIVLTAPFDGRVIYLAASQGEIVDTSKFITIADFSHPMLTVSMDETNIAQFTVGSKALVVFDALPEQTFTGTVVQVNPSLVSSGFYQVAQGIVELDEEAARTVQNLILGLNASVDVIDSEATGVLLVPISALKEQNDGTYSVMVVDSSGSMTPRIVEVGLMNDDYAEIRSGLEVGELVSTGLTVAQSNGTSDEEDQMPFDGMMMPEGGGMPPDSGGVMPPGR